VRTASNAGGELQAERFVEGSLEIEQRSFRDIRRYGLGRQLLAQ